MQRGLSLVELMVGATVGLLIVGAATQLFVGYLATNHRVLIETRARQELRAAAELVARDLRRAAYWRNALRMVAAAGASGAANPYRTVSSGADVIGYSYALDDDDAVGADERFGYRVRDFMLQALIGGRWQALTDPGAVRILAFDVVPTTRSIELYDSCACLLRMTCESNQFRDLDPDTGAIGVHYAARPRLDVRQYALRVRAQASQDAKVVLELSETIRVRNDEVVGACPL